MLAAEWLVMSFMCASRVCVRVQALCMSADVKVAQVFADMLPFQASM